MTCLFPKEKIFEIIVEIIVSIANHHQEFCHMYSPSPVKSNPKSKQKLKCWDHYTLICENAVEVARFHEEYLGFKYLRSIDVNSGTVQADEVDMKNYVMQPPGNPHMSMVVTEGLNDKTIFRKYLKNRGRGIHHLAFQVDGIEGVFQSLRARGVKTVSDTVTNDLLSGLKQFFINPGHAGFYIELIERPVSLSEAPNSENILNVKKVGDHLVEKKN